MKSPLTILICSMLACSQISFSQSCSVNSSWDTQAEVDAFLTDNPGCHKISSFVIVNNESGGLTNLNALANVDTIMGDLIIDTYAGMDISGLSSLKYVGGHLTLTATDDLDLSGLSNLEYSDGIQIFAGCANMDQLVSYHTSGLGLEIVLSDPNCTIHNAFPALTTSNSIELNGNCSVFTGFDSFTQSQGALMTLHMVGDTIDVLHHFQCCALVDIDITSSSNSGGVLSGFDNMTEVGDLYVWPGFQSYPSFNALERGQNLWVDVADAENFPRFESLENVYFISYLADFDTLTFNHLDSAGWINFSSISGSGYMNPFPQLSYLSGLGLDNISNGNLDIFPVLDSMSVSEYGFTGFNISNCSNLSDCDAQWLCNSLNVLPLIGDVYISNNGVGCSSLEEFAAGCEFSYSSGLVYVDLDCDGTYNNSDFPWPHTSIVNQNNELVGQQFQDGHYVIVLPDNTTTSITPEAFNGLTTDDVYSYATTTSSQAFLNQDIAYCPVPDYYDASIDIAAISVSPGNSFFVNLIVSNHAFQTVEAIVMLDLSDISGWTVAGISNGGTVSGNEISWSLPSLSFQNPTYLNVEILVPFNAVVGDQISLSAMVDISPTGLTDVDLSNNTDSMNCTVIASFDPNNKLVDPIAVDLASFNPTTGVELSYVVNFQNTGTAPANVVRVRDILSSDFDMASFEMIASSHSFTLSFLENREIEWLFEDINLMDSMSNEAESHGWIMFKIRTADNFTGSVDLQNSASIYFDYNEPVITNSAITTFYNCSEQPSVDSPQSICQGESSEAVLNGDWSSVIWSENSQLIGSGNSLLLDQLEVGSHEIVISYANSNCEGMENFVVEVLPIPETPVITQNGNVLIASGSGLFTWTFNGQTLSETDGEIEITASGEYNVWLTTDNCISNVSSGNYIYTDVEELKSQSITVFPNPCVEQFTLSGKNVNIGDELIVRDISGRVVMQKRMSQVPVKIETSQLSPGCYSIEIIGSFILRTQFVRSNP